MLLCTIAHNRCQRCMDDAFHSRVQLATLLEMSLDAIIVIVSRVLTKIVANLLWLGTLRWLGTLLGDSHTVFSIVSRRRQGFKFFWQW